MVLSNIYTTRCKINKHTSKQLHTSN